MKCVQQGRPCAKHAICIISPASRKNGWGQCNHHNFHFTNEDTESLWGCETPTLPVTWGWRPVWVPRSTCHIPSLSGHFPTSNCVLGLWRHIWSFLLDSTCLRGRKCLYVPYYSPCSAWHRTDSKSLLNEWSHGEPIPSSAFERRVICCQSSPVFSRLLFYGIGFQEKSFDGGNSESTHTPSLVCTQTCPVKRQDGQDFQPRIQTPGCS